MQGHKVSAVYLETPTHKAISEYAKLSGQTINQVCKTALDELCPVFEQMVIALTDIKNGKEKKEVLEKYLENTIEIATKDLDND